MTGKVQQADKTADEGIWDTVKVVLQALAIAFIIRIFFYQPFNIPSGSMKPTLLVGDYIFVSKLSYGYSRYSFNFGFFGLFKFGPLEFDGRYFASKPERGDVIVFKLPINTDTDYIKRLIGLPGDRIQVRHSVLYINGKKIKRERIGTFKSPDLEGNMITYATFRETLPNKVTYTTLDRGPDFGMPDNTIEYVVPKGHYFMMGDNRDSSADSRYLNGVGYVPYENFVGKAKIIFFSHQAGVKWWQMWKWPFSTRWSRFFNLVH